MLLSVPVISKCKLLMVLSQMEFYSFLYFMDTWTLWTLATRYGLNGPGIESR